MGSQPTAQVDLEAGAGIAVGRWQHHALESDVRGLDAGAGVGAAVDVQRQGLRQLAALDEVGESAFQLGHGGCGGDLSFHDGQLAVFDAGAGDGAAAEHGRPGGEAQGVELGHQRFNLVLGDVQHNQLLVRSGAQAVGTAGFEGVCQLHQLCAGEAARNRGGADEELAVLLFVHAHVVARGGRLGCGGTVGQLVAEVFVLEDLAELLRAPVGHQELQACLGAHPAVTVVTEDAGDAEPHVGCLLRRDEGSEALAKHRVG
ncbi:hypothetical protein D9M72_497130 [compost metagenome]